MKRKILIGLSGLLMSQVASASGLLKVIFTASLLISGSQGLIDPQGLPSGSDCVLSTNAQYMACVSGYTGPLVGGSDTLGKGQYAFLSPNMATGVNLFADLSASESYQNIVDNSTYTAAKKILDADDTLWHVEKRSAGVKLYLYAPKSMTDSERKEIYSEAIQIAEDHGFVDPVTKLSEDFRARDLGNNNGEAAEDTSGASSLQHSSYYLITLGTASLLISSIL